MTIASTDYHDYVFKDGELIGDFDGMYRHSADVPWHQDRTAYEVGADIDIAIMRSRRYQTICDAGCGLGYFTDRLRRELRNPTGNAPSITGFDTSPTAIESASARFSNIRFIVADLVSARPDVPATYFDLVVVRDLLWYISSELERFLERIVTWVRPDGDGGHIHITQSFPGVEQWVGKDVIGSPEDLLERFARITTVTYWCVEHDHRWSGAGVLHMFGEVK